MSNTTQNDSSAPPEPPTTPPASHVNQPETTPATHKYGPDLRLTSSPTNFLNARNCLAKEMNGRWFGAMPVAEFFERYLPAQEQLPELPDDPFGHVPRDATESQLYDPFIDAIEQWMPQFKAVNTSTKPDTTNGTNLKPDISIYHRDENGTPPNKTDFSTMELWMEFKANSGGMAFKDPNNGEQGPSIRNESFTPQTVIGQQARGQLAHYAGAQHSEQLRHHSFSVVIEKDRARFLRWETGATVVTASFSYRDHPEHMAEFFWRFNHLGRRERGHDVSVRPAELPSDEKTRVRETLGMKKDAPLFQYEVPGLIGKGYAYGPRLTSDNRSLASRCTRSSPMMWIPNKDSFGACEDGETDPWSEERLIYLKDTWRYVSDKMTPEHEIYNTLHSHGTPNIPKLVTGGDVSGGRTRADELVDAPWLCGEPVISSFQHYRLVHGVVGRPLLQFQCTKQLVTAVFDALQAHSHAVRAAKLLHRDISATNIILTKDGRGLLIDWEMSKMLDREGSRRPDRTGTWQFMSAKLLQNPGKHHTLEDDLESFLHVLAWMTLRYVPTVDSYLAKHRGKDMTMFDQLLRYHGDPDSGGELKRATLALGEYPSTTYKPQSQTPLFKLLKELREPFKALYGEAPADEDRNKICPDFDQSDWGLIELYRVIDRYDQHIKSLQSPTWFIETIKKALDKQEWPTDDKADENLPFAYPDETERQEKNRASQRQQTQTIWKQSFASSNGSKRAAGSTFAEPSSKRHCGTSVGSGTGN